MLSIKRFEKLDLEKFRSNEINNALSISGGNTADTHAINGGCTCWSDAGTYNLSDGTSFSYERDKTEYDGNGDERETDFDM